MKNINITCPSCQHEFPFNVTEALHQDIKTIVESEYKEKHLKNLRKQIEEELSGELESYKRQLQEKVKETKQLNTLKAEFEKVRREKEELKESLEAEMQKKLTEALKIEKEKFIKGHDTKNKMQLDEKEHIIQQLKEQLKIAQQKAEQGSMQIQGEVQELAIEEYLISAFSNDEISEVKKGARGADCLQTVKSQLGEECGTIYYESKRTKNFQPAWIDKFREDIREKQAAHGVLVTDVYPKGVDRMTNIKGVWVCSFEEFKGLSHILRQSILDIHTIVSSQENKGSKMEVLYDYLTGTEFKGHIESIVEGYVQMQDDLSKEKRAMESIWKRREKQLSSVLTNTTQFYGSIQGIAGNKAVGDIEQLMLTDSHT